jgi:hypothetical protein
MSPEWSRRGYCVSGSGFDSAQPAITMLGAVASKGELRDCQGPKRNAIAASSSPRSHSFHTRLRLFNAQVGAFEANLTPSQWPP